jgi:feruloyl-CoA synthase
MMKPLRSIALGTRGNVVNKRADGTILLSSPEQLKPYRKRYTESLEHWAAMAPNRIFLGQRKSDGSWRTITYRDAYCSVQSLSQFFIDRGLSLERPLMILSGNDIEHALLGLAAMHVGVGYAPISVSFSLLSADHGKLRHTFQLLTPGLVFTANGRIFEQAIAAVVPETVELLVTHDAPSGRRTTLFDDAVATPITSAVAEHSRYVGEHTVAKILFTSGSSAMPKGAINTNGMLCANQQMSAQTWPFLSETPPIFVDWLPWSHTFGGNFVFGLALHFGGSLYIDNGRPTPNDIGKTVQSIRDIRPTCYFGVPKSYEMLLPHFDADPGFRGAFFDRLQMIFYAAASLPAAVSDSLRKHSIAETGQRIFTTTSLGSTETAPLAITANWDADEPGIVGLPVPGVELKLVPNGRKLELRVRGPNITPGYWRQPDATAKAFDNEGWYCMGDAVRFADPANTDLGLVFDGRIAEDFKLSTGTWVNVGPLRAMVNSALSPLVRDVCITGHDRDEVGLLIFPEFEACRKLSGLPETTSNKEIVQSEALRRELQKRLDAIAAASTSSSNRVARAIVLAEPLSDVEVTDKATLSFNVVLERRRRDIVELYENSDSRRVLTAAVPLEAAAPRHWSLARRGRPRGT